MSATCPIPECGYAGAPGSVEAHISGSTTGGHSGVLGREMREQIAGGFPWAKLAAVVVVLVVLYLAEQGGNDDQEGGGADDRATVLVDPTEPALAQEVRRG